MMEMQILRGTSATESNSMPFTFPCSTLIMNRAILFAKEHVLITTNRRLELDFEI